jgi:hypothetical protein
MTFYILIYKMSKNNSILEKILSINAIGENIPISPKNRTQYDKEYKTSGKWLGYTIVTNKQTISFKMENIQFCCESYGAQLVYPKKSTGAFYTKEDMIGCVLRKFNNNSVVKWGKCNGKNVDKVDGDGHHFATLEVNTEYGIIQMICYNDHNGYYKHDLKVKWLNYKDTQEL